MSHDIVEISTILGLKYSERNCNDYNVSNAMLVLACLTETIDDNFLVDRAEDIKNEFEENTEFQRLLSFLYDDICFLHRCGSCCLQKYCNHNIANLRKKYDSKAPKIIDLFCGAGGLSLGFTQMGFITSFAIDIEPCCVDTYSHNHPEIPRKYIMLGDINDALDNLRDYLRFQEVDVIIGGPPCQGFSMANRQRVIDDPRNRLYKSYVKVVDLIKPKFFVMENVPGMLSVSEQIIEDFSNIGYSVHCQIINAKDFSVPQNRERLIFIGNRIGIDNSFVFSLLAAKSIECHKYVLSDALFGLKPLVASRVKNDTERNSVDSGSAIDIQYNNISNEYINLINQGNNSEFVYNHKARYNNDRDIEIYGRLNQGDNSNDPKIADIMPYARRSNIFKDKYYKLEQNKVCKTITAHMRFDCNMYIHPTQARGLTPREAARIQSYPDDYFFRGSYTKTYMQIGNSVPPLLGRAIASVIREILEEEDEL